MSLIQRIFGWIGDLWYALSCKVHHLFAGKKVASVQDKKRKSMIFYCCMMAFPLLQFCIMYIGVNFQSILLAFQKYNIDMSFTWTMENFTEVIHNFFHNNVLRNSFVNSIKFYFLTTGICLPTSLFISFYLYKKWKFAKQYKIMLFIPSMIAGIVTVTCFYYLADRGWPHLVKLFTGKEDTLGLLVNNETALPTLLFYNIFYGLAGNFLFLTSAMSNIDQSISEAAQIDGANIMQEFIRVTLPMIYPMLTTFVVGGFAGMLIGDYGMYAFSKTAAGSAADTMGRYFTEGVTGNGAEIRFPYYAALGLILTVLSSAIVFTVRGIMNRFNPFREEKPRKKSRR